MVRQTNTSGQRPFGGDPPSERPGDQAFGEAA
jgi:hypothetical protein